MPMPTFPLAPLEAFRTERHACCTRRADAMFEWGEALWCAQTPLPSLPHLSLEPVCRRGWGSVYAALSHGEVGRVLWSGGVEGVVVDLGGVLELVAGS